jgi:hypothetical protein
MDTSDESSTLILSSDSKVTAYTSRRYVPLEFVSIPSVGFSKREALVDIRHIFAAIYQNLK